jgi:hypothetical protein
MTMNRLNLSVMLTLVAAVTAGACGGSTATPPPPCEGEERCNCYPNGTCNAGLECLSHLCVATTTGVAGAAGNVGSAGAGGSASGAAGTGAGVGGSIAGTGGGSTAGTGGSASANLIKNGDFALGKTYWDLTYQAGEVAGSDYSNGEYCVANLSTSLYLSFSLGYPPTPSDAFAIAPGAPYTLTYRARFVAGFSGALQPAVTVKIGHASPPYDMLVSFTGDTITTNYSTFTHIINSATGDTGAGLVFNGTLDYYSEVCFDDVKLIKN